MQIIDIDNKMSNIVLDVESLAYGGSGIARHEDVVYFVNGGVPGDRIKANITKIKKRYREAEILEILKASKHRVQPQCKYYKECGGCQWQHIDYTFQLSSKVKELESAFKKNKVPVDEKTIEKAVESPEKFAYRRMARFKVKKDIKTGKIIMGFYSEKTNKIVEIDKCILLDKKLNEKLKEIKIEDHRIIGFDLFIDDDGKVSVQYRFSEKDQGADFYQVNPHINRLMVSYIIKAAARLKEGFTLADIYCGAGNLSLGFATKASTIMGWDYSKQAVSKGNLIASKMLKKIENCKIEYHTTDVYRNWNKIAKKVSKADLLIIDPPRKGLKNICQQIAKTEVPIIIYISCSPPALARDIKVFTNNNYSIEQIKPFDMFPQTYHLETVTILKKK